MSSNYINIPSSGSAPGYLKVVPTLTDLPTTATQGYIIEVADADGAGNANLYQFSNGSWSPVAAGGVASVSSVNGKTGIVTLTQADIGPITGSPNTIAGFNSSMDLASIPGFNVDTTTGGPKINLTENLSGVSGNLDIAAIQVNLDPTSNSPDMKWTVLAAHANVDTAADGFQLGTNGGAVDVLSLSLQHTGKSDLGDVAMTNNYLNLGNGTDPITVRGVDYSRGYGNINSGVTVTGPIQGFGFQPNVDAGSTLTPGSCYIQGFHDNANIQAPCGNYSSFQASPQIVSIDNNANFTGLSIGPNIPTFTGNANFSAIGIYPQLGNFGAGSFNAINIAPTVADVDYAVGLNINMNDVHVPAGTQASVIIQDLTITATNTGPGDNGTSIQYTPGATAGSEVVSAVGQAITIQIQSGVSTATQIKAALDSWGPGSGNFNTTISGVGSNPQVTQAATFLSGGTNSGTKRAIDVTGDVNINGSLTFTGMLSLGAINSFAQITMPSGAGILSVDTLATEVDVPPGATITGTDVIGVNTACSIVVGAGATVSTNFIGITALGLPAVVQLDSGATVDTIAGASFALSLSGIGTGGSIDKVSLCRAVGIPDGLTVVNNLYGYKMDAPFGSVGVNEWGVYISPAIPNYFAGSIKVGDTSGDTPAAAIEIDSTTRAFLNARMTTAQRDALAAQNGMQLYNTTTDKLQVFAAGVWVDLH